MIGFDPRFARVLATPEDPRFLALYRLDQAPLGGESSPCWWTARRRLPHRAAPVWSSPASAATTACLADEMEGFTRTFIMVAPWLHQAKTPVLRDTDAPDRSGGFYKQGLLSGTDPKSPEYWGDVTDYAQHLVELSSLAWGLWQSRRHIWDTFTRPEREQVAAYLRQCLGKKYHPNNWQLFNVMVNTFLKGEGLDYNAEELQTYLANVESYYLGEGWYKDGGHTSSTSIPPGPSITTCRSGASWTANPTRPASRGSRNAWGPSSTTISTSSARTAVFRVLGAR